MTISLSKNILAKFENSLTRSILEYELISIANGADLTSFTKRHAEADKKILLHSYQSTFRGCNKLEETALPGFVDFSDETILADFQAKAKCKVFGSSSDEVSLPFTQLGAGTFP